MSNLNRFMFIVSASFCMAVVVTAAMPAGSPIRMSGKLFGALAITIALVLAAIAPWERKP